MNTANQKINAIYLRLSRDDELEGDSNSIQNQRLMLEEYAKKNGFTNTQVFVDDGFSGTNFNRPDFQKMMALVEDGKVETVIVKDMSRFGRNYIEVGIYTEQIFPQFGVRFIAVNDGVDSLYGENELTPFRNIMNEWYARDTSKKVRSVFKSKAERGERVATRAPYGYRKVFDESKSSNAAKKLYHLEPDEQTASIVQHIFELCTQGLGPSQIANRLVHEQVPTPVAYVFETEGVTLMGYDPDRRFEWHDTTVVKILENPTYLGHTVNLRYQKASYKLKKKVERPREEWLIFKNTHTAIISQEIWDIVQEVRRNKRKRTNMDTVNKYLGLVYCRDCGAQMVLHRSRSMKKALYNFMCGTYKKSGKEACGTHFIREVLLDEIVLSELRRVTAFAREHEDVFAKHIGQKSNEANRMLLGRKERELNGMRRRADELNSLFKRLYEDNVLGRINNEQFRLLSDGYMDEQYDLTKKRIPKTEAEIREIQNSLINVQRFIDKAKRYTDITELSFDALQVFISKIEIGERKTKNDPNAEQDIYIYFKDVGLVDEELFRQEDTNVA